MPEKILFLDIDGVLNRCGASGQGLETDKVELLAHIVRETQCRIVLSSTWRKSPAQLLRIVLLCTQSLNTNLLGTTPILEKKGEHIWSAVPRGREIQAWLDAHHPAYQNNPPTIAILDDNDDMEHLRPHLIHTNSFEGLTPALAEETIRRLNTPKRPQQRTATL